MLPEFVQIGPMLFQISDEQDLYLKECKNQQADLYGACLLDKQIILLAPDLESDMKTETLQHEILHVIAHQSGLQLKMSKEEKIVRAVSPALLDTYRRNPEVTKFLLTGNPKGKF